MFTICRRNENECIKNHYNGIDCFIYAGHPVLLQRAQLEKRQNKHSKLWAYGADLSFEPDLYMEIEKAI